MNVPDTESIFLASPDILCVFGFDACFTLVNPACAQILGQPAESLRGRYYLEFAHPDDLKASGNAIRRLAGGEGNVMWHCRFGRPDGTYRRLQWHANPDSERRRVYAVARDLSEFSVNDELLRDSETQSLATIENALEGVLRTLPSGQVIMANPAAVSMLGYESPEGLIERLSYLGHNLYADTEDFEVLKEHLTREGIVTVECQLRRRDDTVIWVSLKARTVRLPSGALGYYETLLRDISKERKLEDALQVSETRYRSLVENAPFGIYRISLDGQFLDVNHALVAMLGYESREEVMMLNIEADVYCEPGIRQLLIAQFGNTERIGGVVADWRRKNGTPIAVRLSARKVRDAYGVLEGFEVIAEDLNAVQEGQYIASRKG